eukprot:54735-Amphidinium_carterae.1
MPQLSSAASSAAGQTSLAAQSERSRSPAQRTHKSSAGPMVSPDDKVRSQINKYLVELDLAKILVDQKLVNEISNANRILTSAKKDTVAFSDEIIQMENKLLMVGIAQKMSVKRITKVPVAERAENLTKLMPRLTEYPWAWCAAILEVTLRDSRCESAADIAGFIESVAVGDPTGMVG